MSNQAILRITGVSQDYLLYCLCLTHVRRLRKSRRTQIYVCFTAKIGNPPSAVQLTLVTAIAVACRDVDVRNVKAMIVGPPDTPYEFGFFDVRCVLVSAFHTIGADCDHIV